MFSRGARRPCGDFRIGAFGPSAVARSAPWPGRHTAPAGVDAFSSRLDVPMASLMTVQGQVRRSGLQGLHAWRPGWHGERSSATGLSSATDLILGFDAVAAGRSPAVRPEYVEVVVAPEWLTDLHDPTLVISPAYVGPDRRRVDRSAPPNRSWGFRSARRIVRVVYMTALVVVPLTMTVNRSVPPAAVGTPPPAAREATTVAGMPGHVGPHVSAVSRRKAVRAETGYRRALADWRARQAVGGVGAPSAASSRADLALRSAVRASAAQSGVNERAWTRAVAAQLRADHRAAKVGARAAKAAGGGHHAGAGT